MAFARKCCSSCQWSSRSQRRSWLALVWKVALANMLEIKNLHVSVGDKPILKGLTLSIEAGQVHAIMSPNGSGKSTLSYVLAGRAGYDITEGSITYNGEDLVALAPEERAAKGVFLAMQYPVAIPGVTTMTFLKTALNSQRRARGETEMDALRGV